MKKNTCYSLTAILLISFFIFSCKEKKNENLKPGQVEFAFSAKTLKSSLKSENSDTITGPVSVDEVRIYNRALSQEEITILYQQ